MILKRLRAALLGKVTLPSFHIASIGVCVLSNSASFRSMIFCNIDGALDVDDFEGGPRGGKRLEERETALVPEMSEEPEP